MPFSRFSLTVTVSLFIILAALIVAPGAFAAEPMPQPVVEKTAITPEQARHTLSILQDDSKRAQLEQTLGAIAQASEGSAAPAPAEPTPAPIAATEEKAPIALTQGGLLAQLFAAATRRMEAAAGWFRLSAHAAIGFRGIGGWWQESMGTAQQRTAVFLALGKLILTLAGALLAEWLLRRILARPRRVLRHRAAPESTPDSTLQMPAQTPSATATDTPSPQAAGRYLSLLRRIPFALLRGVLELLPLLGFLGVAGVLLSMLGEPITLFYNATIAIIEAYAVTRISLAVLHLFVSPDRQSLRLLHIGNAAAAFLNRWLSWIVVISIFGMAAADVLLELGAGQDVHSAFAKLVGLTVHVVLLIMMWRSRKAVAAAIRGPAADRQSLAGLRGVLADIWPFFAAFIIVAVWVLLSGGAQDGFARLVHFFGWSAAVILGASLISIFFLGAIDRAFIRNHENVPGQPAEPTPQSPYQSLVHNAIYVVIAIVTALVLLRVWGFDIRAWFQEGSVGRRLASAAATIGITCVLAVAAWEGLNIAIGRRIDRWRQAGDIARVARLRTLVPMVRTTLFVIIAMIVLLTALNQLGVTIAPLLAGASIIGVALGFGSQKLVQDFITGIFLLMENAMQVGDFVTVASLSGTVEYLSIRTVRLRAGDGSVHLVPFSSVSTVTNTNRGLGNAAVKVSVTADSDVDQVLDAIKSVGGRLRADPKFKNLILADIDIWGIDQVDGQMITIVGQIPAVDKGRWGVQREFNRQILLCFRERNIQFVNPKETTIVNAASTAPMQAMQQGHDKGALAKPGSEAAS